MELIQYRAQWLYSGTSFFIIAGDTYIVSALFLPRSRLFKLKLIQYRICSRVYIYFVYQLQNLRTITKSYLFCLYWLLKLILMSQKRGISKINEESFTILHVPFFFLPLIVFIFSELSHKLKTYSYLTLH